MVISRIQDIAGHHPHPDLHRGARLSRTTPPTARLPFAAGALVLLLVLSGCSRAPEVSVPRARPTPPVAAAGPGRRPSPGRASSRRAPTPRRPRLGQPGGHRPLRPRAAGPTTDPCVVVDGVGLGGADLSDGASATTYGRDPAIEVLIPRAYAPNRCSCRGAPPATPPARGTTAREPVGAQRKPVRRISARVMSSRR